jgi:hypothetical protein
MQDSYYCILTQVQVKFRVEYVKPCPHFHQPRNRSGMNLNTTMIAYKHHDRHTGGG